MKKEDQEQQPKPKRQLVRGQIRFPQENGSDPQFRPDDNTALAVRRRDAWQAGSGWAGKTVGAMDGAIEPPW
ncbi:hypothetical protein, partial [uncultured Stenotrophomonas sp.]|uniref:hypothetical protein n=1 Tax=uncultured Stenotrophomonas sp. TaxID=165438 RepID=UPI0025D541CB